MDRVRQLKREEKPYFKGRYKTVAKAELPAAGTLDYWLFERYYLFNTAGGTVISIGIHHLPWTPAKAAVTYDKHSLNSLLPGNLKGEAVRAHYVKALDVLFWLPEKL